MTISITAPKIKIKQLIFSAGEVHIQLENIPKLMPKHIDIRADIHSSNDLMALLLVHNSLSNHYGSGLIIHLTIPYFPYARQDRVCSEGQAFSLQVIAKMVNDLTLHSITVWDAHSPATQALTGAINIAPEIIIAKNKTLVDYLQDKNSVMICPDKGAIAKSKNIKQFFSVKHMIYAEKIRAPATGNIIDTQLPTEDLSRKTAIILDDICDGGRTFIEIAKKLKANNVKRIILYVTHGIFSKGLNVFDGLIDEIYTSNSFKQKEDKRLTIINYK